MKAQTQGRDGNFRKCRSDEEILGRNILVLLKERVENHRLFNFQIRESDQYLVKFIGLYIRGRSILEPPKLE